MIPKIIHYCWFGRNPLPKMAQKCIASWRKFFPDYEIREWNEDNFDVNLIPYTQQAYEEKKYAFVSDFARFWILYHCGGVYFDTDVEVIKPMDNIIERGPFMGCENIDEKKIDVAPGLGLGVTIRHEIYKELLDYYANLSFRKEDGTLNVKTIVPITTEVLMRHGLIITNKIQKVMGIWIYPKDYFNPLDSLTGRLKTTANTCSIHWYMNSWGNNSPFRTWLSHVSHRIFGLKLHKIINKLKK